MKPSTSSKEAARAPEQVQREDLSKRALELLGGMGADMSRLDPAGSWLACSPIDGSELARLRPSSVGDVDEACALAARAFAHWREVPAPRRAELARLLGQELRLAKSELGELVSIETGKMLSEGLGEVQEMIDICDFAVGLSRTMAGLTIPSERPGHRMMEQWHPLGIVGVISAFNFPVAVWAWNAALALVCGDPVIWKPSDKAPLCALAVMGLLGSACAEFGDAPEGLCQVLQGGADLGAALAAHPSVALLSATGSTRMGRSVAPVVASRFGRCLLELGGNNAVVVAPSANMDMALAGILFGAYGTAGQRCTTTRRVIIHESIFEDFVERLDRARARLPMGSPLQAGALVGPLIDQGAYEAMSEAISVAQGQGADVRGGGLDQAMQALYPGAFYAVPALAKLRGHLPICERETFAPLLYAMPYADLCSAIAMNNQVDQGLSSSIFTSDLAEAETFLGAAGSDCGIVNINIGTSGAEIGGAFGGEKHTGGGRESGSDAWKAYMRRATNTINRSSSIPLAQGVVFDIGEA
jgi:aldehyde dehydrogenase (NAD+)